MPTPPIGDFAIVIAMALLVGIFWKGQSLEKAHDGKEPTPTGTDWLTRLADHQDQSVESIVYFSKDYPSIEVIDDRSSVDLNVEIINASVFDITVTHVEGRVRWADNEFQRDLEVFGIRVLKSGDRLMLIVRQPIRQPEIASMKRTGRLTLDGSGIRIYFSYGNRFGMTKTFSKMIPWPKTYSYAFTP